MDDLDSVAGDSAFLHTCTNTCVRACTHKLFKAIEVGNETTAKLLLDWGADINKVDKDNTYNGGRTPLFVATYKGHKGCVKLLLEAGADINKANNYGKTPLRMAAAYGHEACVKLLIEAGADMDKADDDGTTPLYIAAAYDTDAYEYVCVRMREPTERECVCEEEKSGK